MSGRPTRHTESMGREHAGATRIWVGGAAAALALAACGNVVVDDSASGTGPTTTTQGGPGGSATTSTTSTPVTTMTSTPVTTTTSSPVTETGTSCVAGCNDAITSGTMPCYGLGFALYGLLVADASTCADCTDNLVVFLAASPSCLSCLEASFPIDVQNCVAH